ncbi:MAG TPA: molecular chaperone HtpG [Rhodospirillaceae bacterium]|nr:molecular chaperone HtpG [Rhodospirillaceae bacterium]
MTTENMNFGADVSRLLEIVTHALYTNRDVFLRELVSNAADACDRLRYDSIQNPSLTKGHKGYEIRIVPDTKERVLAIMDSGIGMTREELIENLGTIAKSGTKALMEQLKQSSATGGPSLIGQFGVGFYSCFMVAHSVDVISRRAGSDDVWIWSSTGNDGFAIREATKDEAAQLLTTSGTTIRLKLKDEACDFFLEDKIKIVVTTYSNHINLPVYVGKDSAEAVNSASALWMKPKSEITEADYNEFFSITSNSLGTDVPLITAHWKAEGKIEYTALLFVPHLRPWDLYDPSRKHCVRLYVRRVFISDDCSGLVYPWLRFLRGVIDSEDLPLNISRESLQENAIVGKIRSGVAKHILGDLDKLSRHDAIAFQSFWLQFGAVVKEGLYDAPEHRDDIFKIARFHSTHSRDLTSLDDYVSRMKEGQDSIYYISGENADSLRNSPQIEGLKKRDLEVLIFSDTIDDFWLPIVMDFKGKKFVSVTKGAIDLSKFPVAGKQDGSEAVEVQARSSLISFLKIHLNEWVSDVRVSDRLTDSPVCLVASDKDADLNVTRILKANQNYDAKAKPVLEINADHPLIDQLDALAETSTESPALCDAADLLLDQARIIQGEPVNDPTAFARRMADFLRRGLAA